MKTQLPRSTCAIKMPVGLSRRQVLAGMAVAAAAPTGAKLAFANADAPAPVKDWLLKPGTTPLQIPADFLGLHSDHGVSRRAPPPTYPYDAIRSHDVDNGRGQTATQWADIEFRPGVYNWRLTDKWFETHQGKTVIWVLFGCPRFYQKYPDERFPFPYLPGGGSPPKDPRVAAAFISAVLERYRGKIQFVEIWNEPNFGPGPDPKTDRWTPDLPEAGWFTGTASELSEMARLVRAVLPDGVKLMAGAWAWQANEVNTTPNNSVMRYAIAPDGAGGVGRDHVDAISVHLYTYNNDPNAIVQELRNYAELFDACGYPRDMPRYISEVGAWYPAIYTATTPPLADKIRNVKRWCMIPAALGYRGVYLYKHSSLQTLGNPGAVPEISAAIGEMRNGLRERTLTSAAVLEDETIWLSFADGSTLRA